MATTTQSNICQHILLLSSRFDIHKGNTHAYHLLMLLYSWEGLQVSKVIGNRFLILIVPLTILSIVFPFWHITMHSCGWPPLQVLQISLLSQFLALSCGFIGCKHPKLYFLLIGSWLCSSKPCPWISGNCPIYDFLHSLCMVINS